MIDQTKYCRFLTSGFSSLSLSLSVSETQTLIS